MRDYIGVSPKRWPKPGTTNVQLHSLPPTTAAAVYHSSCTLVFPSSWMDGEVGQFGPRKMGMAPNKGSTWTTNHIFPPAPDDLLKVVRCQCKTDCDTRRCTCKKHGLELHVANAKELAAPTRSWFRGRTKRLRAYDMQTVNIEALMTILILLVNTLTILILFPNPLVNLCVQHRVHSCWW